MGRLQLGIYVRVAEPNSGTKIVRWRVQRPCGIDGFARVAFGSNRKRGRRIGFSSGSLLIYQKLFDSKTLVDSRCVCRGF
jgi:hypothetical protein